MQIRGLRQGSFRPKIAAMLGVVMFCLAVASGSTLPCSRQLLITTNGDVELHYACNSPGMTQVPSIPDNDKTHTVSLSLRRNGLRFLLPNSFQGLVNLRHLDLEDNNILGLVDGVLDPLVNVERIDFSTNKISYITQGAFAKNTKLRTLNLDSNLLKRIIPNTFQSLPSNAYIELSDNPLVQDHLLCKGLYYGNKQFTYNLNWILERDFLLGGNITSLCSQPCNEWRPAYMNVCPDAFCRGTLANHVCVKTHFDQALASACPQTSSVLKMVSSKEVNFPDAKQQCQIISGSLPSWQEFIYGCPQRLLAKVRSHLNLHYTPVAWLDQMDPYGTAYATNRLTYFPNARKIYYICSVHMP
ncbi:uncharacterized protein LOC135820568 [Sycon ciliatum]|uniref:uncharacterized protein LOC135820568 n=1 Tax=Sycon ciliatum TaxID=27933 RepID=UPI0031F63FC0